MVKESSSDQDITANVYVIYGNNHAMGKRIHTLLKNNSLHPMTKEMVSNLTGEGAPFASRIIDVAFEHAQAVLVLLSGEEQVRLRQHLHKAHEPSYETNFSPQATLAQIFEAGYAFGKIPERTILLQTDNVRPFSDIAGRDILTFTGEKAECIQLLQRLSSVGCHVSSNNFPQPVLSVQGDTPMEKATDPRRVFVVYGRDEDVTRELFKFLKMLDLAPMSWREAVSATNLGSPYTGEILVALLKEAQAVIILLTGDDEVQANGSNFMYKMKNNHESLYLPRPNVVFETGMSLSSTRLAKRTILVQHGDVRIWDAINGRNRIKLSDKMKHRSELATSLKNADCAVQIPVDKKLFREIGYFGV